MTLPGTEPSVVILYTTVGCHLCEQAEEMLSLLIETSEWVVEAVDISSSEELVSKYGIRIPVIMRADGTELGWPFDLEALEDFLCG